MKALLLVGDLVGIVILAQAATLGFLAKQATPVFTGRQMPSRPSKKPRRCKNENWVCFAEKRFTI